MNINVVGTSGSGKSTLARRLAHRLELPWIELDRLYWRTGWNYPGSSSIACTGGRTGRARRMRHFSPPLPPRRPRRAGCWMAITIAAAALNGVRWIW
ncbi:(d)CMP kinase [Klebsiella pneumoniae]|nr:(d)CMP kinase [Klebsiella pneumoniae]